MKQDIQVRNEGSIVQFILLTKKAKTWVRENVQSEPWQWMGSSLCVDWRYAEDLFQGMLEAGLKLD